MIPTVDTITIPTEPAPSAPKRGRGRPPGSKNRTTPKSARTAADVIAAAADPATGPSPSTPRTGPGRPTVRDTRNETLTDGLRSMYVGAGAILATGGAITGNARMAAAGDAMVTNADQCARALVAWSEQNSQVRKALEMIATAGGAGLVLSAHAPIIMAALNPPTPGTPSLADMMATVFATVPDATNA